ncbi:MAG: alpha/beta fold hydrolase [Thermoguttaceae bacterium]|nr:alpha/beta fold hydrolase [Thermoguttaceae bacterium]MDW8078862.1 alpha/beta fold hydrolase [Thermoguttaceae bacterium]
MPCKPEDWLPWLRQPLTPDKPRLLCFPYAGGGSWIFGRWPSFLDGEIQVLPVVPPGREHRLKEPPLECVQEMARQMMQSVKGILGGAPYALFGHSLGALVAFELCREIERSDCPLPQLLVVSGCRAPHLPRTWVPIHSLPPREFEKAVEDRFGPLPLPLRRDKRTLEVYLRILRADMKAVETYGFERSTPLRTPVLVCGGREDPFVPVGDLFPWVDLCGSRFVIELFPGGHFFLRENPRDFLKALKQHLLKMGS